MGSAVVTCHFARPIASAVQRESLRQTMRLPGLPGRRSPTTAVLRKNPRGLLRRRRAAAPHPRAPVPCRHDRGLAGRRCGPSASPRREEEHSTEPLRSSESAASLGGTLHGSLSPSSEEPKARPRSRWDPSAPRDCGVLGPHPVTAGGWSTYGGCSVRTSRAAMGSADALRTHAAPRMGLGRVPSPLPLYRRVVGSVGVETSGLAIRHHLPAGGSVSFVTGGLLLGYGVPARVPYARAAEPTETHPVTLPSDADDTSRAYFAITPDV